MPFNTPRPTREQILDYLSRHPLSTAAQIAVALGLTASDVRYHLGLLVKEGAVIAVAKESRRGKGRPATQFRLTPKSQQVYLEPLTRALLRSLRKILPEGEMERTLAETLGGVGSDGNHPLRVRLQSAMARLENLHFAPRWEAHRFGPRVIFQRCPYAELVQEYPELCRADRLMLEQMLGVSVEAVAVGAPPCVFAVKERGKGV